MIKEWSSLPVKSREVKRILDAGFDEQKIIFIYFFFFVWEAEWRRRPWLQACSLVLLSSQVLQAAHDALRTHGNGLSSVRFICGTQVWVFPPLKFFRFHLINYRLLTSILCLFFCSQDIHKNLEATISKFHGTEDTILFPSCFDANAGIFEALLTPEDAVLSDEFASWKNNTDNNKKQGWGGEGRRNGATSKTSTSSLFQLPIFLPITPRFPKIFNFCFFFFFFFFLLRFKGFNIRE